MTTTITPTGICPIPGDHKGKLLINKSIPFYYLNWILTCGKSSARLKMQVREALAYRANN